MSEWVVKNLDEVVEYFIDYRGKTPVKTGSGIPLITAKIVKDGCLQTPTEFISVEDYPLWMTRGYPEVNDVVLTTEAPLGEVALIKNKNVALAQRIITLRGYKNILDNKFLKYWLQSEQGQYELESRASGTTVFGIKSSILKKIPISLPPYNEQVAISSVLYSIDEKIDLLHRQNKTLESMAETLFRQWFDVDSNEKWQEKNVLDIFTLVGGGTPKTSVAEYWTDEIPWISGGDISSAHQGYLYRTEKSISLAGLQNSSAKLLPKNSTVISARGTVGKYALLARDMAFSQSNYGIVSKIGSYPFFI
ncbi:TPA: restriction endonuclease subunit S, partial [Enterobacter hormaechei subsp. hoffmannii]|nr:restriction endonuclease subunit S [Enterobacter hormaechei subsp. hoffmannii]